MTPILHLTQKKITMSVLFILISASLAIALVFLGAFIWSVKSGQYEDDYTPSVRILFDEPENSKPADKTK
jgi:cbb3-type cytochrome oxidase maturation protein